MTTNTNTAPLPFASLPFQPRLRSPEHKIPIHDPMPTTTSTWQHAQQEYVEHAAAHPSSPLRLQRGTVHPPQSAAPTEELSHMVLPLSENQQHQQHHHPFGPPKKLEPPFVEERPASCSPTSVCPTSDPDLAAAPPASASLAASRPEASLTTMNSAASGSALGLNVCWEPIPPAPPSHPSQPYHRAQQPAPLGHEFTPHLPRPLLLAHQGAANENMDLSQHHDYPPPTPSAPPPYDDQAQIHPSSWTSQTTDQLSSDPATSATICSRIDTFPSTPSETIFLPTANSTVTSTPISTCYPTYSAAPCATRMTGNVLDDLQHKPYEINPFFSTSELGDSSIHHHQKGMEADHHYSSSLLFSH